MGYCNKEKELYHIFKKEQLYFTNPCILDCDLETVRGLLAERKPYEGYVVGVPSKMIEDRTNAPSWLPKFLGVARADYYDKDRGFIAE